MRKKNLPLDIFIPIYFIRSHFRWLGSHAPLRAGSSAERASYRHVLVLHLPRTPFCERVATVDLRRGTGPRTELTPRRVQLRVPRRVGHLVARVLQPLQGQTA